MKGNVQVVQPTCTVNNMTMTNGNNIEDLSTRELVTLLEFIDGVLDTLDEQSYKLTDLINNMDSNIRAFGRGQRAVYVNLQEDFGNIYDAINELLIKRWTRK